MPNKEALHLWIYLIVIRYTFIEMYYKYFCILQLVVVVYIMVVLWLVSANFRASVSSVAGSGNSLARGVIRHVVNSRNNPSGMRKESSSSPCISGIRSEQGIINYNITEDSDDEELEALLVVRDKGKGARADVSTNLDQEEDDGDLV